MEYKESKRVGYLNYDIEIKDGNLYFSEYEDNPRGTQNGTRCNLNEFCLGTGDEALRVRDLIRSTRGKEELNRIMQIATSYL